MAETYEAASELKEKKKHLVPEIVHPVSKHPPALRTKLAANFVMTLLLAAKVYTTVDDDKCLLGMHLQFSTAVEYLINRLHQMISKPQYLTRAAVHQTLVEHRHYIQNVTLIARSSRD